MAALGNPRLRRLQADYQDVRAVFSGHPHVSVQPYGSRLPPERYRVQFRLRGLTLSGEQPVFRDVHDIEITLPRNYPAEKPYCVPLQPIFHPNIKDHFCIADYWAAGMSLVDVIVKLGDMIQWQVYNPRSPLDAIAARWAVAQEEMNPGVLPVGKVNLGVADVDVKLKPHPTIAPLRPVDSAAADSAGGPVAAVADDDFVVTLRS
jgi:ubiquitin-protein ligase